MNRNEALELLEMFTQFLLKHGYTDLDIIGQNNEPSAIDEFTSRPYFKNKYPINKSLGRAS